MCFSKNFFGFKGLFCDNFVFLSDEKNKITMKNFLGISTIILGLFLASCGDKKEKEIQKIPIETSVTRFDSLFFKTPITEFDRLKNDFPYLFPSDVPDSVWTNKRTDVLQQELYAEVLKTFPDFSAEKKELISLFQHIKYYFPKFSPPNILTLTSDVDYHSRVIYTDTLVVVGLDNYLGANHRFYQGIAEYISFSFDKKYLPTDVALAISDVIVPHQRNVTFLDAMIYEGKRLFLAQKFLPKTSEVTLLKYPQEKYNWAVANEAEIWRYFVQNQLLYNTDKKTLDRFIHLTPFSKFYMEHDSESPGGIGRFIGLHIVTAFMKNDSDNLEKLLKTPSEEIFKQANYKPAK